MTNAMRPSTLEKLGLGTVLGIFKNGRIPADAAGLVDKIFGPAGHRGAMVISGANGIVGAGKVMQFASRLRPFDVPVIALDMAGSPDGIGKQFAQLAKAFGEDGANAIMNNVVRLTYDGKTLPQQLKNYDPKFLLEAIPEKLELKKAHYALFRKEFPDIHIWSVTSGFPSSELGVGIAHPAFPHEVNKIFEIVEPEPSAHTQLLWALGLIPMQVSDDWAFVLDVYFCGLMLAGLRYHDLTNMPYWKIDKLVRQVVGPNPFRAHDAIGAKGANFLTWSCLHHLGLKYGPLFTPNEELVEKKDSGQNWYPPDHFRPLVNWQIDEAGRETLRAMILGPLFQMTTLMLAEKRADLTTMNAIGELCAQFTVGIPALMRRLGEKEVLHTIAAFHKLYPEAAKTKWYPAELKKMNSPEWAQLYVNAEHDWNAGAITISRESYNSDVDLELNHAIDWLRAQGIKRVIVTGDFHYATQMVGADTSEFFPAVTDGKEGERIAYSWSATARRLHNEFDISVGFVNGKRCMGGMLELMMHCHYLIAAEDATLAMPEVTLPVVPGMEGCHWSMRKATPAGRKQLMRMLLEGAQVKAKNATEWLVDYAGSLEDALRMAWRVMEKGAAALPLRKVEERSMEQIPLADLNIPMSSDASVEEARRAIARCITDSCSVPLSEAILIQARHSAEFMTGKLCRKGKVGSEYDKVNQ